MPIMCYAYDNLIGAFLHSGSDCKRRLQLKDPHSAGTACHLSTLAEVVTLAEDPQSPP